MKQQPLASEIMDTQGALERVAKNLQELRAALISPQTAAVKPSQLLIDEVEAVAEQLRSLGQALREA